MPPEQSLEESLYMYDEQLLVLRMLVHSRGLFGIPYA